VPDGDEVGEAEAVPEDVVELVDDPPPQAVTAPTTAAADATAAQARKLILIALLPSDACWTSPGPWCRGRSSIKPDGSQ
jgi:hypothetical protein